MFIFRNAKNLVVSTPFFRNERNISNKLSLLTKLHRSHYLRLYPTVVVQADGSSFTIRYHEPRKIIKLPLDLSTLSEEERKAMLEQRKPKKKIKTQEEEEDTFNAEQYLQFLKNK